jgi:PEP-CTERM motif-containing protein
MNHVLGVVTALLALASASAATAAVSVSMIVSSLPIVPGGIITLQTFVTANAGEIDNTIFGAIQYNDALLNPLPASNTQTPLFSSQGALTCTTAFCVSFSQVNPAGPIALNLTDTLIATTTFHVDPGNPPGTVINFRWRTTPSTQRLDWFGITNAPGHSVTVAAIPEPTTAALLGAGLLGIALAVRRRT